MKKIIISLVALSTLSGAVLASDTRDSNSRNSDYNQAFFSKHNSVDSDHTYGSHALKVQHAKAKTSDQSLGLKTNYHGEYIN